MMNGNCSLNKEKSFWDPLSTMKETPIADMVVMGVEACLVMKMALKDQSNIFYTLYLMGVIKYSIVKVMSRLLKHP